MAVASDLSRREALARQHESNRDWADAAGAWAAIADALGRGGDAERAAKAWDAAGEAWRRDDKPALADKALRTALALTQEPGTVAITRVKRSGCLVALGRISEARSTLYQAMMGPNHVQAVVADGLVDLSIVQADVPSAATWAARIQGDQDVVVATRAYRQAQVARLNGDLDAAVRGLDSCEGALPGAAGRAAVMGERAEVWSLKGQASKALDARREAIALHAQEKRRAPELSAIAALVRTAAELDVTLTHVPGLDGSDDLSAGLDAQARAMSNAGLVLVSLDLQIARALMQRDGAALTQAANMAAELGAVYRQGRALAVGTLIGVLPSDAVVTARAALAKVPVWMQRLAHLG